MNAGTLLEIGALSLQNFVLIPIIWSSARMMKAGRHGIFPAFFTFAMLSLLLCNLYGSVNSMLNPGVRLPFAADEIADCAMVFLLCAGLEALNRKKEKPLIRDLLFSLIFMGINIMLWIIWSGEWIQDIVFGIPYIYLMYLLLHGVRKTRAVNRKEALLAGTACCSIVFLQGLKLLVDSSVGKWLEGACHGLEYSVSVWFIWKSMQALKEEETEEKALFLSLLGFLWTLLVSFMSADILYSMSLIMNTATLPVMLAAVKRKGVRE